MSRASAIYKHAEKNCHGNPRWKAQKSGLIKVLEELIIENCPYLLCTHTQIDWRIKMNSKHDKVKGLYDKLYYSQTISKSKHYSW